MCSLSYPIIIPDFRSLPTVLGGPGIMTTTVQAEMGHDTSPNNHQGGAGMAQTMNGKSTPRSSSASSSSSSPDQPDPDTIKMFVGQVPRSMDEHQLRVMFEDFGPVFQINVLRDKITGQSKGCCFVTFYTRKSALEAQNALHNIKTLPGMHHPIQMKPADTENRNERKLFVGMVSKKLSENDVRTIFSSFGTIEECTVLRDTNGVSKGCAFVTFSSRQCAIVAIKAMHHSQTMEGCSSPLVVKFADTQKDKEQKKVQQLQNNLWSLAGINTPQTNNIITSPYLTALPQLPQMNGINGAHSVASPQTLGGSPSMSALPAPSMTSSGGINLNMLTLQQILTGSPLTLSNGTAMVNSTSNGPTGYSTLMTVATPPTTTNSTMATQSTHQSLLLPSSGQTDHLASSLLSSYPSLNLSGFFQAASRVNLPSQNQLALAAFGLPSGLAQFMSGNSSFQALNSGLQASQLVAQTNGYTQAVSRATSGLGLSIPVSNTDVISTNSHLTGIPSLLNSTTTSSVSPYQGVIAQSQSAESAAVTAAAMQAAAAASGLSGLKQHEGPDGANLFIYHLPQEYSDSDLLQTFQPFGNIISAKVFIDKQTNLSKCFGFVSYDNPVSALAAINAMNGFQIGTKRLKVQLKRSRDAGKPY